MVLLLRPRPSGCGVRRIYHPHIKGCDPDVHLIDFVVSYNTPMWITNLGWKIFIMYAAINFGAMGTFSSIIPETKGRSLEEMDIIFGAVSAETRQQGIERQQVALGYTKDENLSSASSDSKVKV